jgi:type IV pilus assembly protein PilA
VANCVQCGNALAASDRFCAVCGRLVPGVSAPIAASSPLTPGAHAPTSGKAIASLICGVFFFVLPSSIAAVVLGHLSLSEIKKSAGRIQGQGLAIAGLVLGYMGLAVIPIAIIAAIAIPNLLRARIAANEASAVSALRVITTAEVNYQQEHRDKGFTCDLKELRSAGAIDANVASGFKNGYVIKLENCSAGDEGAAVRKYQVIARPLRRNQTGRRTFCSDESAVIRADLSDSVEACLESGKTLE